jgi:hydrogenase expression/formation protein HypE
MLGHGGGGQLSRQLLRDKMGRLYEDASYMMHDSAVFKASSERLAFTTDSFVVQPLFFPGGDIGSLSVFGTVNDLAMSGARPDSMSFAVIMEEGLRLDCLERVIDSVQESMRLCGVRCLTGDTKVVEQGKGDGLFINTSGIGSLHHDRIIHPSRIRDGDAIVLSGDLGRHGVAVMTARSQAVLQNDVLSDCATLYPMVAGLLNKGLDIHCLRDLTRGGLASALNELAEAACLGAIVWEESIPLLPAVHACCEILGLDPLVLPNEGRFICVLPEAEAETACREMKQHAGGQGAVVLGRFLSEGAPDVRIRSSWGTERLLVMPSGEVLPRIC